MSDKDSTENHESNTKITSQNVYVRNVHVHKVCYKATTENIC